MTDVMIAEIREIFTLFDKDADGYVATEDLGTIIRGLNMNPSQREVEEMVRDVDPTASGTFSLNQLHSLIAKRPRKDYTLEEIVEALKMATGQEEQEKGDGNDKEKKAVIPKMQVPDFLSAMESSGKSTGEELDRSEVEQIIKDSH